jgi:hypothetical protein
MTAMSDNPTVWITYDCPNCERDIDVNVGNARQFKKQCPHCYQEIIITAKWAEQEPSGHPAKHRITKGGDIKEGN